MSRKQNTHFVLALAKALGVELKLAPAAQGENPQGVGRFVRTVTSSTQTGALPPK